MPPSPLPARTAFIERNTKETKIQVSLSLDGGALDLLPSSTHFPSTPSSSTSSLAHASSPFSLPPIPEQTEETHASQTSPSQQIWIWTGIGFLDHMLHALAKHAGWSLRLRSRGDLATNLLTQLTPPPSHAVDDHHTTEDTLLALGAAFSTALGARTGLARFGTAHAPLDEALARAVIDLSNRPFFVGVFGFQTEKIGTLSTQMIHHGLQSWSQAAGVTLHVDVLRGENDHHRAESAFKALAGAVREACRRVEGREGEVVSTKGVL
ncbi:imidazoleglycerol-phosphate dehydratase [Xylographa trunciseda]|nr:imidazoleglycerol-phosphate dehydratase [Xylographa trunciseda]